jgi:hypothetical protein
MASGVADGRPHLLALLKDRRTSRIVVEQKDYLTRFGFRYLETQWELQGRTIEVVNVAENSSDDWIADLVAIVYSFTARLYGQRRAKRKTERVVQELRDATRHQWGTLTLHHGTTEGTRPDGYSVKQFLDSKEPTRLNPHYKSAAPMRLYTASRVEVAESCEDWKTAVVRAQVRSERGKGVAARKAAALVRRQERFRSRSHGSLWIRWERGLLLPTMLFTRNSSGSEVTTTRKLASRAILLF